MRGSINFPMVVRTLCVLLLFEAAFMLFPFAVALASGETGAVAAFGYGALITAACGFAGRHFINPSRRDMTKRDGILLTALVWIVFSLFGLIPYMMAPSTRLGFSEAFFEAMSAFTTTGASLVESTDSLSKAIHIWRCQSQWIGGLGIIIFTVALLPMLNSSGGMQMFNAEQNKISQEKVSPRISDTARRVWLVYLLLTLILFGLLCAGPMPVFESACYAMSTMSTGGFATTSAGVNDFTTVYVKVMLTLFMFVGGVNFAMVYLASTGKPRALFRNEPFVTYCKVIIGATAIFSLSIFCFSDSASGWEHYTIDPLFQVVSWITSTGFILEGVDGWGSPVLIIALMLIFTGGCAGSTSGGAKIDRIVYMLKFVRIELKRVLRPNSVMAVRISNRTIGWERINSVLAFLFIYVTVIVVGSVLLTFAGLDMEEAFIVSFITIGNSSLSSADSMLGCDYHTYGMAARYILSALMLIGRLELFSILVIFTRTFWRR